MNATDGVERDVPTTASPESWDVTTNLGTTALSSQRCVPPRPRRTIR